MGRSTGSCFKIISCGCINKSVDRDDIDVSSESKGPNKSGWNISKKSPTRQEPSNTVITEKIPSSENKEIPEPITIISEPQINTNISEKSSDNIWTEEIPNSVTKNATVSSVVTKPSFEEDDIKREPDPDESKLESELESESESEAAVLVIQAAVRRFLAERRMVKHKNVVKLQAAVRGHLVRNHAVGTLRCVQAIVKMQTLVRARRNQGVQNAGINSTPAYISIEKLLSNRLARQLLESTPKTKQINIKCDPSKTDSAWNWLERWMSVSSPETQELHTPDHHQDKDVNVMENKGKMVISANSVGEATVRFEEKENLINIEDDFNVTIHEEKPLPEPNLENPDIETVIETEHDPIPEDPVSESKPDPIPEDPVSESKPDPISKDPVSESKPDPVSENRVSESQPKQTDSEGRKYVFGSRKASNPAFIAAQSRFEKLTSFKSNPLTSPDSSNQVDETGSRSGSCLENGSSDPLKSAKPDNVAGSGSGSPADIGSFDQVKPDNEISPCVEVGSFVPEKETVMTDVELVNHGSRMVHNGGSECGTELSITSTLDSPDQFELKNKKFEETKTLNEAVDDMSNNINIDAMMGQKPNDSDIGLEPKSNEPEPILQSESPRSHITTLESQGTPSSQISTTTKKSKSNKKVSGQNPKSWSTNKKSSPVRSVDSGLRTSLERLPKDPKPVKRRISSGSPNPDHTDHEPLVPSYMQATESTRAKAVANGSPRSSPDVHDNLKERHSLPGAVNGRQGSPRVQRSMSQALQTTKGNGSQEKKWQR